MKDFLLTAIAVVFLCAIAIVMASARILPSAAKPTFSQRKIERKIDWNTEPKRPYFHFAP